MATMTGTNLLESIVESTGVELNGLVSAILSAKLQQMIDNGSYSKLAASIAISGFSTLINDATGIRDLSDAVEANAALIAAATEGEVDTIVFPIYGGDTPGGTFALTTGATSVDEGSTATFTITGAGNAVEGSNVTYTISGVDAADTDTALAGTATLGADLTATISVALEADLTTEGAETLTVTLADGTTADVTVNDTSVAITPVSNINNSLGTLSDLNTHGVSALASGSYWDQSTKTVTYSFNESIPSEYYDYEPETLPLTQGWTAFNTEQKTAFQSIAEQVNQLLGITLQEVSSAGQVRLNIVNMEASTSGFAFYPGTDDGYQGDMFFSQDFNAENSDYGLNPGETGWSTMVHELGHALGLDHSFEGNDTLPVNEENTAHSIMSYTQIESYKLNFQLDGEGDISMNAIQIDPQLYSLYDVAALQAIYGINNTTNIEDSTYTFSFTDFAMQTIWDTGGNDTLNLSENLGDTTLDLRGGTLNSVDQYSVNKIVTYYQNQVNVEDYNSWIESQVTDQNTQNKLYTGHNNLAIAQGSVIENITTGSGNDIVTDNEVNNIINTSSGDDKIYIGNGGFDTINAGEGSDTLYLDLLSNQISVTTQDNETYSIIEDTFAVNFIGVENIHFSDNTLFSVADLIG